MLRRARGPERIGHLRRGHACRLGQLRKGRERWLLRRGCAGLERLLLLSLLELLALLPWVARELGLLLRRRLLLLLLEALRLTRIASELLLQLAAREASGLRCQSALEAARLLVGLLLAILRLLPRSGAIPTP